MEKIKKRVKRQRVPRYVAIIAKRLNMVFQPNRGSSFYKRPSIKKIIDDQKEWNSPLGTLRLSDHWNYENSRDDIAYKTNITILEDTWILCVNSGLKERPWKVLEIFNQKKGNVIRNINFRKIQSEVDQILLLLPRERLHNNADTPIG
jgi:hypothetical protein